VALVLNDALIERDDAIFAALKHLQDVLPVEKHNPRNAERRVALLCLFNQHIQRVIMTG